MPPSKFRQMVESAKQQLNVEDDTFRPTPCVRTDAMLAEVDNFGRAVLTYRTAVLQYAQHMNGEGIPAPSLDDSATLHACSCRYASYASSTTCEASKDTAVASRHTGLHRPRRSGHRPRQSGTHSENLPAMLRPTPSWSHAQACYRRTPASRAATCRACGTPLSLVACLSPSAMTCPRPIPCALVGTLTRTGGR